MTVLSDAASFALTCMGWLPDQQDVDVRQAEYWNLLEVNYDRVLQEMNDVETVARILETLDAAGAQVLCSWLGWPALQSSHDVASLAQYCAENPEEPGLVLTMLLRDFVRGRRHDAIETISRLILEPARFDNVYSSDIDLNSKRFAYALLAFIDNPHWLRVLMLFEAAERSGYTRYDLTIPTPQDLEDQEEFAVEAQRLIEQGIDPNQLNVGLVNDVLEQFELHHGHRQSICFDVFADAERGRVLIFIFRALRETYIREVDRTVFAEEADLVVIRVLDGMRSIEEHSIGKVGVDIAAALASQVMGVSVHFVESSETTTIHDFLQLVDALRTNADPRLNLRELYMSSTPVEDTPLLMIRSVTEQSIARSLQNIQQHGIDLLAELDNIKHIKIGFAVPITAQSDKVYSFKVSITPAGLDRLFLPYSVANIATRIRDEFEDYIRNTYDVRVIPATQ